MKTKVSLHARITPSTLFLCTVAGLLSLCSPLTAVALPIDQAGISNEELCISEYYQHKEPLKDSYSITQSDAERLINRIISTLGVPDQIVVISCTLVPDAKAYVVEKDRIFPTSEDHVPKGEYVIYNSSWTRQVIGTDLTLAVILFGHEVGHIIDGDDEERRSQVPILQKEADADGFAGCAAARFGISWTSVEDLLSRIRDEQDTDHPNRLKSLEAARTRYTGCRGVTLPSVSQPEIVAAGYIYYEETNGSPTEDGVFSPLDRSPAPPYNAIRVGDVLRAVKPAELREKPTSLSALSGKLQAGDCVRVTNPPTAPFPVQNASSGGHLQVNALGKCPDEVALIQMNGGGSWASYSEFLYYRPGLQNPGSFTRLTDTTWQETGVDLRTPRVWTEVDQDASPGRLRLKDGPVIVEISPKDMTIYYTGPERENYPHLEKLDEITAIKNGR